MDAGGVVLLIGVVLINAYLATLIIAVLRAERKERLEREVRWIVARFRNGVVL